MKMLYISPTRLDQMGSYLVYIILRDKHRFPKETTYKVEVLVGKPPRSQDLWKTLSEDPSLKSRIKVVRASVSKISESGMLVLQFNNTETFNPRIIKPAMINPRAFQVYSRK
jgi:hypothetical protein